MPPNSARVAVVTSPVSLGLPASPAEFRADVSLDKRRILSAWVARVVVQPVRSEPDTLDPELRHALTRIPERGGRVLRVVYNHQVHPGRVVTVYFDRKAGKTL